MKVFGFSASPRGKNSSTLRLVEAAVEGACQAGAQVEVIDLTRFRINYCKYCSNCYNTGKCVQDDDLSFITGKIFEADGIVLGSPNDIDCVSAQLRKLMERMEDTRHCQMLDGKYAFSVSTTGSSGEEIVLKYMNEFLTGCGATVIGSVGVSLGKDPSMDIARERSYEMGKDLVMAINEKRRYPEQDIIHDMFRKDFAATVKLYREKWSHDHHYWAKKGWI